VAGAVTVVGPADRWTPDLMRRAAAGITDECAALSAALGSLPPVD
jgi:DNA-binding IclR family transcriptional regulator